jgi:hypothetical protein
VEDPLNFLESLGLLPEFDNNTTACARKREKTSIQESLKEFGLFETDMRKRSMSSRDAQNHRLGSYLSKHGRANDTLLFFEKRGLV